VTWQRARGPDAAETRRRARQMWKSLCAAASWVTGTPNTARGRTSGCQPPAAKARSTAASAVR